MIAKIIIGLFAFQVAYGQQVLESDIRDLISQTEQEMNDYILPLVARMQAFGAGIVDEARRLETERADLRKEIENLALELSNGADVSVCLRIALVDVDRIFADREHELSVFNSVGFNSFNQVFIDLGLVNDEEKSLVSETEQSIQACNALSDAEEVSNCFSLARDIFDEMKQDIINRIMKLNEVGQEALASAEKSQQEFNDGNRQFVSESSEVTRQELTTCIQNL